MTFAEFLAAEGRGALSRVQYATRISRPTLVRARDGKPVTPAIAAAISLATDGLVPVKLLERGSAEAAA